MASVDVIARIEASTQDGGWRSTGAVFGDADRLQFYQQLTAWFDLYGSGAWEAGPRAAFVGHLSPEPWLKTFQSSTADWNAFTAQEVMKKGNIQGIFYKNVASSPANRHQIIDLSYAKIVYEMISGHCNLMDNSQAAIYDPQLWAGAFTSPTFQEGYVFLDLDISGSTLVSDYLVREGGFWERIEEMAQRDLYLAYTDQAGVFHFVPHPMFDAALPSPVFELTADLLLQPLRIERRNTETVGQIIIQGTTPQGLQISGRYPADPAIGPIVTRAGYLATTDTIMTTLATRQYKFSNRDYRIEAKLPGAVGLMLDLLDRLSVTYTSSADGIAWSSKKFWIDSIAVEILENFKAVTTLVMDAENS